MIWIEKTFMEGSNIWTAIDNIGYIIWHEKKWEEYRPVFKNHLYNI